MVSSSSLGSVETSPSLNTEPASDGEKVTWRSVLAGEREKPYFRELLAFIEAERAAGKIIYPKNGEIFHALASTPFDRVRVVILGQDPYHGPQQAHGLCFSVRAPTPPPPSLQNIFKELKDDLGVALPTHGCLEAWARQGVLLLNAILSVEAGRPLSHANRGWEIFTDRIIEAINLNRRGVIFLLWGSPAQKKGAIIDRSRHVVMTAPHPSPLSAHRGFFGCKHFSKVNNLLRERGESEIDWSLA